MTWSVVKFPRVSTRVHENDRSLHAFTKNVEDLLVDWEIDTSKKEALLTSGEISKLLLVNCEKVSPMAAEVYFILLPPLITPQHLICNFCNCIDMIDSRIP